MWIAILISLTTISWVYSDEPLQPTSSPLPLSRLKIQYPPMDGRTQKVLDMKEPPKSLETGLRLKAVVQCIDASGHRYKVGDEGYNECAASSQLIQQPRAPGEPPMNPSTLSVDFGK